MRSALVVLAFGTGIGSAVALTWYGVCFVRRWKNRCNAPNKAEWTFIGTLKDITMFPVKSCHGLEMETVECDAFGIHWQGFRDRRFLLLNAADQIGFAGTYPRLLSIQPKIISANLLQLSAPDVEPLMLSVGQLNTLNKAKVVLKKKKGYQLQLIECLPEHHQWFSKVVCQQETGLRLFISLDPIVDKSLWRQHKTDIMPFMVVNDSSLEDLNKRIGSKNQVHQQQFRGNFLIKSAEPNKAFDEDNWMWLRIGEDADNSTILRYNSPCLRCILPNIDIFTCQRNADFEPLKTLKKYRLRSNSKEPEMGVYFDLFKAGVAKRGDRVYVQYRN